jgi:hypothetical protein
MENTLQEGGLAPTTLTREEVSSLLAPGRPLDLLLEGRGSWRQQAVCRSRVLERDGDELIIRTPQPPLPSPLLGLGVEVTALGETGQGQIRRFAYRSSILDVLEDHPGAVEPDSALVVIYPSPRDIYATNLRKARRYQVPPEAPLGLTVSGQAMRLLDISLKGLRFSDQGLLAPCRPGDGIEMVLSIHDQAQRAKGRVAGVDAAEGRQEVSVELGIMPLDVWTSLSEALLELEHALRRRGDRA